MVNTSFEKQPFTPSLTDLAKNGYIDDYPGDVTNGKPRTYYRITPSGRNFLAVKAAEWERVKTVVDPFLKQPLTNL